MKKLEVFYDFSCPFCFKGHKSLVELINENPGIEVEWNPCEISVFKDPSEETYGSLSIPGLFFAMDNGVDLWQYHEKVFKMIFEDEVDAKDMDAFLKGLEGFLDVKALREALVSGKYVEKLKTANRYAFKETGVHVVPTYRADGGVLKDRQEFYGLGPSDTGYGGRK